MSDIIKIMLADNNILIRQGIKVLLELDKNIKVIDEADNGYECLSKIEYSLPDLLILEINMPEKDGIEVLKEINDKKINVKTLVLTTYEDPIYLLESLNNGANGYILKNVDVSELKNAVYSILKGEKYIQSDLLKNINSKKNAENYNYLTKRECEVLIKVASGLSNKEIATNLNVSERTVKNHISNIFKKIRVSDRTQAAIYAIKNHIVYI